MQTFIKVNGENCVIITPENPNGYGVILAGDHDGYVSMNSSDFHIEGVKFAFLRHLSRLGYTIGYCNAKEKHWGNPEVIKNIQCLHHVLVDSLRINPYVHLFGIGMGGTTCLNILSTKNIPVMSCVLLHPILDLFAHRSYIIEREGEDQIGYELSTACEIKYSERLVT